MAIYEESDFWKQNDKKQNKINKAADKLKRMRIKKVADEKAKLNDNIETSSELEQYFTLELKRENDEH